MANIVLTVTVTGGLPPVSIQARFFSPDGNHLDLASANSFSHTYDNLTSGNYDIYITGMNPAGGQTVCVAAFSKGIKLITPDASPATNTGTSYSTEFHFRVP